MSLFPESIRWMIQKGKKTAAEKAVRRIATVNRLSMPERVLKAGLEPSTTDGRATRETVFQLFQHWPTAKVTLIMFFTWSGSRQLLDHCRRAGNENESL